MEGSKKCAEYLLTKNVGRCMNEIKKRWISYGRFTGKITILDATKEEINDLTRITGIRFERDKIKLSVKDGIFFPDVTASEIAANADLTSFFAILSISFSVYSFSEVPRKSEICA